jgi:aryl-alcohol dehydrogenase
MKITAALEDDSGRFTLQELDLEEPREDEVLVKIAACGICHTDLAMRSSGYLLGHEASGTVVQAGTQVPNLKPGDKIVTALPHCGKCAACKDGHTYDCVHLDRFFGGLREDGTTPLARNGKPVFPLMRQGGFSTHAVCHKSSLTKVNTTAPALDPRFMGPLGCGVITGAGSIMNCLKPAKGKTLAVFGTGAVGLSAILAAKVCGCAPIIAIDRIPSRLRQAREFGATHCLDSGQIKNLATTIRSIAGDLDYAFDTSGSPELLACLRALLNKGGKSCGVGIGGSLHFSRQERNEGKTWETPTAGWSVPQKFIPRLLTLHGKGQFPFEKMIRLYPFKRINQAFADAENGRAIKPVLVMD